MVCIGSHAITCDSYVSVRGRGCLSIIAWLHSININFRPILRENINLPSEAMAAIFTQQGPGHKRTTENGSHIN